MLEDPLSEDENKPSELEQVPQYEQERVKHFFTLGRASAEKDDDEGDGAKGCDGEVEGVPISAQYSVGFRGQLRFRAGSWTRVAARTIARIAVRHHRGLGTAQ